MTTGSIYYISDTPWALSNVVWTKRYVIWAAVSHNAIIISEVIPTGNVPITLSIPDTTVSWEILSSVMDVKQYWIYNFDFTTTAWRSIYIQKFENLVWINMVWVVNSSLKWTVMLAPWKYRLRYYSDTSWWYTSTWRLIGFCW